MTFTLCDDFHHLFEDIKRRQIDETRYYEVGDEVMYPSVTSVLSFISRPRIAAWRQRVGIEEANRKSKRATTRGTRLHKLIEVYMQNGDYKSLPEWEIPLIQLMFRAAKSKLDSKLDNI